MIKFVQCHWWILIHLVNVFHNSLVVNVLIIDGSKKHLVCCLAVGDPGFLNKGWLT